jgi:hypothetical protein
LINTLEKNALKKILGLHRKYWKRHGFNANWEWFLSYSKREESSINDIDFITLAKSSCDQKFYIETLKLKSDEIALFSSFVKPTQNRKHY